MWTIMVPVTFPTAKAAPYLPKDACPAAKDSRPMTRDRRPTAMDSRPAPMDTRLSAMSTKRLAWDAMTPQKEEQEWQDIYQRTTRSS